MRVYSFFQAFTLLFIYSFLNAHIAHSQIWTEPALDEVNKIGTPYDKGARQGLGVDIVLSDFGFSLGTHYRFLFNANSELTSSFSIGALRDVSEQTFTTFYSEVIPNKFNRIISMPLMLGYKQRFLSHLIQDNFRLYSQLSAGINFAYVYPYFYDVNQNGIRDNNNLNYEPALDALSGWDKGFFETGISSEFMLGIDFGSDNKSFSSIRFGVVAHYFPKGIQVMEPVLFNKQHLFISPQFNLIFGSFWKR